MKYPLYNLHNHTPFSDGAYTIDEIVEAHLKLTPRPDAIGICDHLFATPSSRPITNERDFERYFVSEMRSYVAEVHEARRRWAGRMHIFCGAEINMPLNKPMLDQIRGLISGIDYVLFEFLDWAALTFLASQARRWPCPVGLAHTDVAVQFPNTSMDQVVRTLANARIFYEVNTKQMPLRNHEAWFNTMKQHRVFLSLGTDTHDDLACLKTLHQMHSFVVDHGLGDKLFVPPARQEAAVAVG